MSLFKIDKHYQHLINRKNILNFIAHHEAINQSAIARGVGLSIPTVMKIVEEMEAEGIVKRIGKGKPRSGKCPEQRRLACGGRGHRPLKAGDHCYRPFRQRVRPAGRAHRRHGARGRAD